LERVSVAAAAAALTLGDEMVSGLYGAFWDMPARMAESDTQGLT